MQSTITKKKNMSVLQESKWIRFDEIPNEKKKTKTFEINTKDSNALLGHIKWYGAWRCYAFYPEPNTVFERTCMNDIQNFINNLMTQRKVKSQIIK